MEPVKFSILISTKNRKDDLLQTLRSLKPLLDRGATECVVFDDGSDDGTSEAIQAGFPQVILRRNETSRGYIFCRNQMLNETKASFAISLDDDAQFLSPNPLEEIDNHFNANPKCGLIAFRIFWGKTAPESTATSQKPERVKSFVGCGHVWRMEAWRSIRNYPEWFGFYGEENFASVELFSHDWEVHYLPPVLVWHRVDMKARKTMKGFGLRYRRALRADWHLYFLFFPWAKIPKRMGYSVAMQIKKIFGGNFRVAIPIFRALADVLFSLPQYRRNRKALSMHDYEAFGKLPDAKIFWKPGNDR